MHKNLHQKIMYSSDSILVEWDPHLELYDDFLVHFLRMVWPTPELIKEKGALRRKNLWSFRREIYRGEAHIIHI